MAAREDGLSATEEVDEEREDISSDSAGSGDDYDPNEDTNYSTWGRSTSAKSPYTQFMLGNTS